MSIDGVNTILLRSLRAFRAILGVSDLSRSTMLGGSLTFQTGNPCLADRGFHEESYHSVKTRYRKGGVLPVPSNYFPMKTKQTIVAALSLLAVGTAAAQTTVIDATSYNTKTGDISYITGTTTTIGASERTMGDVVNDMKRHNAESQAWADARQQQFQMQMQTLELQKQTRLLEKIANQ